MHLFSSKHFHPVHLPIDSIMHQIHCLQKKEIKQIRILAMHKAFPFTYTNQPYVLQHQAQAKQCYNPRTLLQNPAFENEQTER